MLLALQPLEDVSDVNHFKRVPAWRLTQGDTPRLYFQLVDASRDPGTEGYRWPGARYVPASGALLQVAIHNVDDAKKTRRVATQPFPLQDPSIWALQVLSTDWLQGAPDVLLTLTEFSSPGLTAVAGALSLSAVANAITLTAGGGATFASPPAAGSQLVIGVDSVLYAASASNGGFYTVTGTSTSTSITATKVVDLFYAGLTSPLGAGVPTPVAIAATTDIRVGPGVQTLSGLVQGRLHVAPTSAYAVPYKSQYTDTLDMVNQTGWAG